MTGGCFLVALVSTSMDVRLSRLKPEKTLLACIVHCLSMRTWGLFKLFVLLPDSFNSSKMPRSPGRDPNSCHVRPKKALCSRGKMGGRQRARCHGVNRLLRDADHHQCVLRPRLQLHFPLVLTTTTRHAHLNEEVMVCSINWKAEEKHITVP